MFPDDIGANLLCSTGESRNLYDKDGSRKTIHTLTCYKELITPIRPQTLCIPFKINLVK